MVNTASQTLVNLFLVEDKALITLNQKQMLNHRGYNVIHSFDGENAPRLVNDNKNSFDLILMDKDLGRGKSGIETASGILKGREIPNFFPSSHTEEEEVTGKMNPGFLNSRIISAGKNYAFWAKIQEEKYFYTMFTNKKKNGESITVEASISPVFNEKGEATEFVQIHRDVSKQIQTERNIQIKTAYPGFINKTVLRQSNIHDINEFYSLLTKQLREFSKAVFVSFTEFDKKRRVLKNLKIPASFDVFKKGAHLSGEEILKTAIPVGREYLKEIMEMDLVRSKFNLDLFFDQSLTGFFFMMTLYEPVAWNDSVDKEKALDYILEHQKVTRVNKAFPEQYCASEKQLIGYTVVDFFNTDIMRAREITRELFDLGRLHAETEESRVDGSTVFIEGSYSCIYNSKGEITGTFGTQQDITKRKLAEIEILNLLKQKDVILRESHHRIKNNLMTIIFKHAFHGQLHGKVTATLFRDNSFLSFTISDNGAGISPGYLASVKKGFGLQLIEILSCENDGSINIETGNGTNFYIRMRI